MNAIKKVLAVSPYLLAALPIGLPVSVALAQSNNIPTSPITNASGIQMLLCNVVSWFIWIVILVSVIMVVYAAYSYATAGEDTEKITTGRRTLTYAAVGIIIALCAAGFPTIVESIFPNATYSIPCLGGGAGSSASTAQNLGSGGAGSLGQ